MARTAEELLELKKKRESTDRKKLREERRLATMRARRAKLVDGELIKQLHLTTEELGLLRLELPSLREKWARRASGRGAREVPSSAPAEPAAPEPLPEAAE
jgi:hypothetical protein